MISKESTLIYLPYKSLLSNSAVLRDEELKSQSLLINKVLRIIDTMRSRAWINTGTIADSTSDLITMWLPHELFLLNYQYFTNLELQKRGLTFAGNIGKIVRCSPPNWLGWPPLHYAHRKQLIWEDDEYYRLHTGFQFNLDGVCTDIYPHKHKRTVARWVQQSLERKQKSKKH